MPSQNIAGSSWFPLSLLCQEQLLCTRFRGSESPSGGFPPFQRCVKWSDRHKYIKHKVCKMLFQSVSAAAGLLVPKKGTLVPCPLHPGRSPDPFHVPFVRQCFLPFHHYRLQLLSAHTERSPCSFPQFSHCSCPCQCLVLPFVFQAPIHSLSLEVQFPFVTHPLTLNTSCLKGIFNGKNPSSECETATLPDFLEAFFCRTVCENV